MQCVYTQVVRLVYNYLLSTCINKALSRTAFTSLNMYIFKPSYIVCIVYTWPEISSQTFNYRLIDDERKSKGNFDGSVKFISFHFIPISLSIYWLERRSFWWKIINQIYSKIFLFKIETSTLDTQDRALHQFRIIGNVPLERTLPRERKYKKKMS